MMLPPPPVLDTHNEWCETCQTVVSERAWTLHRQQHEKKAKQEETT